MYKENVYNVRRDVKRPIGYIDVQPVSWRKALAN